MTRAAVELIVAAATLQPIVAIHDIRKCGFADEYVITHTTIQQVVGRVR